MSKAIDFLATRRTAIAGTLTDIISGIAIVAFTFTAAAYLGAL